MSKCLGRHLGCIDSNPVLTTGQLEEALPTYLINQLKQQGLLDPIERSEWFCDDCLEFHLYDISKAPSIYRACINQFPPLYEQVNEMERYNWEWQWGRFKQLLRENNNLELCSEGQSSSCLKLIIGKSPTAWVAWSPIDSASSLLGTAMILRGDVPSLRIILIISGHLMIPHTILHQLDANSIRVVKLNDLLNSGFVIRPEEVVFDNFELNSNSKDSIILDKSQKCLIVMDKVVNLPNAVYRMCCVFFGSNGHVLSKDDYEKRLKELFNGDASGFDLYTSVSTLKKLIEKSCGITLTKVNKLIINKSGLGYQLNREYWVFKVING